MVDGEEWIEANRRTKVRSASCESVSVSRALSWSIYDIHWDGVDDIERHESVSPAQLPTVSRVFNFEHQKEFLKSCSTCFSLIGLTAISGAYVAGMDAGRAYNTFPLMNGKIVPDEYLKDWESKGWRNFLKILLRFSLTIERLALTTLVTVSAVHAMFRGNSNLSSQSKFYINALIENNGRTSRIRYHRIALSRSGPELGKAHTSHSLLLFTVILNWMHSARKPKKLVFVKDLWAHKPA